MKKYSYLIVVTGLVLLTMACSLGSLTGSKAPEAVQAAALPTSAISGVGPVEVRPPPTPPHEARAGHRRD